MNDEEFFAKYLRNHIERGIEILYEEYQKINSPIDFIVELVEI